ncbi:MAG: hypothetical protein Q8941_06555 [Bacteroidota bacterium]|nr:hypothetical protein [Bacteroidota bacterium]
MSVVIKKASGKVCLFTFIVCLCICSRAQNTLSPKNPALNKDTFMCWTGHFEKGKFITGNGAVITLNPKTKEPEINFPDGKDPMQPVIDENNRTDVAEKELQEEGHENENGIKIYPVVAKAIELYERLKEETNTIILQKIDWGEEGNSQVRPLGPAGMQDYLVNKACPRIKPIYDDIMDFVKKIKEDKNPDIPVPPTADYFNCWACDKKKRDNYDTLVKHYVDDFFKEEQKRIRNILSVEKELTLVFGMNTSINGEITEGAHSDASMQEAINQAIGSTKHPTFCTFLEDAPYKLNEALYSIIQYCKKKAELLSRKYLNPHYDLQVQPVILVCLNISRQAALLNMGGEEDYFLPQCASACKALYDDWLDRKVKDRDFTRFADIPFMLGVLRQAILLGYGDNDGLDKKLLKLMNDDQFRLTIDVETNVGHAPVFQIMQYHCDGYLIAVWDEDSTGCLKWIPASAKGDKNMLIYTQLRQAQVTGPSPHLEYAGTHDFYADLQLKVRFCQNEQHDTLFIKSHLLPDPVTGYKWAMAGRTVPGGVFESFSGFQLFIDPMKTGMEMKKEAESGELQKNMQQNLTVNAEQALQKAKQLQQMQRGNMSPGEMQAKLNEVFQSANSADNSLNSLSMNTVKLPVNVSNKNVVLIDQTFDATDFNPTAAQQGLISTGKIRVRLEYKPKE